MAKPDLERAHPAGMGGIQQLWRFPNGYGASVVKTPFSYGGDAGKWELAVIKLEHPTEWKFKLVYDTPITSDVLGHLEYQDIQDILKRVAAISTEPPYPWCHGSPTKADCAARGYCDRDPNCGE